MGKISFGVGVVLRLRTNTAHTEHHTFTQFIECAGDYYFSDCNIKILIGLPSLWYVTSTYVLVVIYVHTYINIYIGFIGNVHAPGYVQFSFE